MFRFQNPYSHGPDTPPPAYSPRDDGRNDPNSMDLDSNPATGSSVAAEPVHYEEPPYWCSIAYYELNSRVGEIYHAQSSNIHVDGFTNPSNHNTNRSAVELPEAPRFFRSVFAQHVSTLNWVLFKCFCAITKPEH
jgi:hypothetical protein